VLVPDFGELVRWNSLFQKDEQVPIQYSVIEDKVANRGRPIETNGQNRVHFSQVDCLYGSGFIRLGPSGVAKDRSSRIREILGDEGKVLPSPAAMERVECEHAGKSEESMELPEKYPEEMN
jgi:hypothetical protein